MYQKLPKFSKRTENSVYKLGRKFEQTLHKEDPQATKKKTRAKSVQYNKKEREAF